MSNQLDPHPRRGKVKTSYNHPRSRARRPRRFPSVEQLECRTLLSLAFDFVRGIGSQPEPDKAILATATAIDATGNVYVTGLFRGTVDFEPNAVVPGDTLTATGASSDIFVAKYSPTGTLSWVRSAGSANNDQGQAIAVDAGGNVFVTGFFRESVDFDPGPSEFVLNAGGTANLFVWKLDTNGNFSPDGFAARAANVPSGSQTQGAAISVNPTGTRVDIAGLVFGTATYGPDTVTTGARESSFVARLDGEGNFQWGRGFVQTSTDAGGRVRVLGIATDAAGNVYTTGDFFGSADFDPGPGTAIRTSTPRADPEGDLTIVPDVFVVRLDTNGNLTPGASWIQTYGSGFEDQGRSIVLGAGGNVYVSGRYAATVDFNPGTTTPGDTLTVPGGFGQFVLNIDQATGGFQRVRDMGVIVDDLEASRTVLGLDNAGNIFVTGAYQNAANIGGQSVPFSGGTDFFVAQLDPNLNVIRALGIGGPEVDISNGLAVNATGQVALVGNYTGPTNFNGTTLPDIGNQEIFVARLRAPEPGPEPVPGQVSVQGIVPVTPDPRTTPVEFVDVVLSGPINPASFTFQAVTLTRDGQNVPLNNTVTVAAINETTYRISGLRSFTLVQGNYQINVSGSGLNGPGGEVGAGVATDSFRKRRVPGDYDGDGIADLATYVFDSAQNRGRFDIQLSGGGTITQFIGGPAEGGTSRDIPIEGDFDGDGRADIAIFQPEFDSTGDGLPDSGNWIIIDSSTGQRREVLFGAPGILDRPAPADYDGDGITDIATFRPDSDLLPGAAEWFILQSRDGALRVQFGAAGGTDLPAPADFTGDGFDDIATFRPVSDLTPGTADWFVLPKDTSITAFRVNFGAAGGADQPVVADYDADGRDDIAAFRSDSDLAPGSADWFILQSQAGARRVTFGIGGRIAAQGYYDSNDAPDLTVFNPQTGQWTIRNAATEATRTVTFGATGSGAVPVLAPLAFRLIATGNQVGSSSIPGPTSFAAMGGQSRTLSNMNLGLAMLSLEPAGSTAAPISDPSESSNNGNVFDLALEDLASGDS